jgi:hypothetical protein
MNLHELKAAHEADPDFLQLVTVPRGQVHRREVLIKLAELGKFAAVMAVPEMREFLTHSDFATFEIQHPVTHEMIAGLVSGGVITSQEAAAINALGTHQVPRWKALGFSEAPHAGDINAALAL